MTNTHTPITEINHERMELRRELYRLALQDNIDDDTAVILFRAASAVSELINTETNLYAAWKRMDDLLAAKGE
jgi:hypothetical protein